MVNLATAAPDAAKPPRACCDEACQIPWAQVSRHDSAQSGQEFASAVALFFYTLCDSVVLVPTGPVCRACLENAFSERVGD